MTTSDLLNEAAALARNGKRVAIVAADHRQREVLRNGLRRRITAAEAELASLFTLGAADARDTFADVLVTLDALQRAGLRELEWLEAIGWRRDEQRKAG